MNTEFDAGKSDRRSWPRMSVGYNEDAEFDYLGYLRDGGIVEDVGIELRGSKSKVNIQFVDGQIAVYKVNGMTSSIVATFGPSKMNALETLKQLREGWTKSEQAKSMRDALNPSLVSSLVRGYDCHKCRRHTEVQTVHGDAFEEDLTCPNCGNELTVHPCFADTRNTKSFRGHDPTCVATTRMIGLYDLDGNKIADDS